MIRQQYVTRSGQAGFVVTLLAATVLMGSSFLAGKILLEAGFPPMLLVGWRFLIAALATLPLVLLDHGLPINASARPRMSLRDCALTITIGLVQTSAVMGLLFLAMHSISASTAAILLFSNPIWVAVLGRLFLGESLDGRRITGLTFGVIGVASAIGLGPDALISTKAVGGELIGLASALCWAIATIINKRASLPLGAWALSFWQMLTGSVVLLALAYAFGERWPGTTTPSQWGWFFWLAIPASTGSFGLWFVALAKGGATTTSGYLFLAPLFTVILSFFILGTSLSWPQAMGGVLIGLAIWLVSSDTRRNPAPEALAEGEP
jgi:drug/metabolite transporter (DMT)-like permease